MSISQSVSQLSQRQIRLIMAILTPFVYFMSFIDLIYPKDNKTIVFGSNTGEFVSGSPKALFEHIRENHSEYKIYFYTPFKKSLGTYAKITYILNFAPLFFKAKSLVSSHPPSDFYPFAWSNRKVLVNTWHGTPLKSMFFADTGDTKSNLKRILRQNKKISAFIVSSKLEAATIAECFLINPRKFYYLGQPRNGILLKKPMDKILPNIMANIPEYTTVILYCPTYRRDAPTKFFPFDDFDLQHLKKFIEENKIIILLRGHVYNKKSENQYLSERIIDFRFEICNDVNVILPEVDILVTDYSSLYIDYLLLDRPCIFVPYDLEEYKRKRGLLYDDYDFWAPGHKVLAYKEFIATIEELVSNKDIYKTRRQEINRLFNFHQTDNSCEKVFKLIENWGKEGES